MYSRHRNPLGDSGIHRKLQWRTLLPRNFTGAGEPGEIELRGAVDRKALPIDGLRAMGPNSKKWNITPEMSEDEKTVLEISNEFLFV